MNNAPDPAAQLDGNPPAAASLTFAHWRLVLLLMFICFLAHFNRVSLVVAADMRIMEEYDISPARMGEIYSAFLVAYTLCMIPGGWLIDRVGARHSLGLVCLGSACFVALTGSVGVLASGTTAALVGLIAIRSVMGIVSAPLHPAAAKSVAEFIPLPRRSMANGMATAAALLGVAGTYTIFGELIERFDWPAAFVIAGGATAIVGVLWLLNPTGPRAMSVGAPAVNPRAMLEPDSTPLPRTNTFWSRNKNLVLLTISYATVGYFQYIFFYWMHYYFESVLELGKENSRIYATLPPVAMAVGMVLGGWLSDRLRASFDARVGRAALAIVTMLTSAALMLAGLAATETFWIVTLLSLSLGVLGLVEGQFWMTAVEVGGRRGGLSAAIFNTGGNAGGIAGPYVTPLVSDALGYGWGAGLALGSAALVVGGILWVWIDVKES